MLARKAIILQDKSGYTWLSSCLLGYVTWSSSQSSWLQSGHVLCFLWGTNGVYTSICYVEESRPPLWCNGQSSWLQIQRSEFDSQSYQIFWEVVGLERGPLSLVSTTEKLFERKSSGSGLESREYGLRDPWRRPRGTFYPQKFALTSPTSGSLSSTRPRFPTHHLLNVSECISTDCK
jgi:hypothetical protein